MWPKFRVLILKRLQLKETWILFFILGIIMMNYPFIEIFNKPTYIGGFPLLYLYLHIGWLVSIFVIYLFTRATDIPDDRDSGTEL